MRGLKFGLALVAATPMMPMAVSAEPLSAGDGLGADRAAIFRIIELKGSAVKWGDPEMGTGATVTYAFATEPMAFSEARNCRAMESMDVLLARSGIDQALYEAETARAFEAWSAAADIQFRLVGDADAADILIGAQTKPVGRAFTNVSYGSAGPSAVRPLEKSLICLNPEQPWKVGFDGDLDVYDLRYTLTHEIGHAIGLDHPGTPSQVMSYRYEERFSTLQPGDTRGAAALYGTPQKLMAETRDALPASISGTPQLSVGEGTRNQQFRALSPVSD